MFFAVGGKRKRCRADKRKERTFRMPKTMISYLTPDLMIDGYRDVTPDLLRSLGKNIVVADIDNTLAPYEMPDPDENIKAWLSDLEKAGISVALVSNNNAERVERFNRDLGLVAFWDCHKPSPEFIRKALERLGGKPENAVFLGDQIFTDVAAARRAGMTAFIVPPIKDKTTLFFRFKRFCERPIIRRYRRIHGEKN